jgi:hypothetical protein
MRALLILIFGLALGGELVWEEVTRTVPLMHYPWWANVLSWIGAPLLVFVWVYYIAVYWYASRTRAAWKARMEGPQGGGVIQALKVLLKVLLVIALLPLIAVVCFVGAPFAFVWGLLQLPLAWLDWRKYGGDYSAYLHRRLETRRERLDREARDKAFYDALKGIKPPTPGPALPRGPETPQVQAEPLARGTDMPTERQRFAEYNTPRQRLERLMDLIHEAVVAGATVNLELGCLDQEADLRLRRIESDLADIMGLPWPLPGEPV